MFTDDIARHNDHIDLIKVCDQLFFKFLEHYFKAAYGQVTAYVAIRTCLSRGDTIALEVATAEITTVSLAKLHVLRISKYIIQVQDIIRLPSVFLPSYSRLIELVGKVIRRQCGQSQEIIGTLNVRLKGLPGEQKSVAA